VVDGIIIYGSSARSTVRTTFLVLVLIPAAAKHIEIPMIASGGFSDPAVWWPPLSGSRRHTWVSAVSFSPSESPIQQS